MDETQHVFPGSGVSELLRVCQREASAMRHWGRSHADFLKLEVRRRLHWVFRVLGEVSLQSLCHCPSQGGFLDQGIPEEMAGGLVCVAVRRPAFVLL